MKLGWLKRSMPRGLFGRAALILVLPVVALQVAISVVFIQRHFEDVTEQMTRGIVYELRLLSDLAAAGEEDTLSTVARGLRVGFSPSDGPVPEGDRRRPLDLSGRLVIRTLYDGLPGLLAVDLAESSREVRLWLDLPDGAWEAVISRRRASASNPHQFLVVTLAFAVLMTGVAFIYLRNQLRPITRLAAAARAFGMGQSMPYAPGGAVEVRAAGTAFLAMRERIERQIAQRTLMLSGVSHDLRTPLTRLKLELSLLPEGPDVTAMQADLEEIESLIDGFLDFARGGIGEAPSPTAPADIARAAVDKAQRAGGAVTLRHLDQDADAPILLRAGAVERALGNLVGNAMRYADHAEVSVIASEDMVQLTVEDDGPGIPPERRVEATEPFTRLDAARNQDRGSGVGLGLSIARDVAKRHGGSLTLGDSRRLGGLAATIALPRVTSLTDEAPSPDLAAPTHAAPAR